MSNRKHNINSVAQQYNNFVTFDPWGLCQQSEEET